MLFHIQYPHIAENVIPRHRFMSAYEQHVETPNKGHQYLLIAAEPYETIAFKIQSRETDRSPGKFWTHWTRFKTIFYSILFKQTISTFEGIANTTAANTLKTTTSLPSTKTPTNTNTTTSTNNNNNNNNSNNINDSSAPTTATETDKDNDTNMDTSTDTKTSA
ncbi:unnamed protein product [Cunninghamella echinulata]